MLEALLDFTKVLIPAVAISTFTAILTVQLSLRRFYSERLWERKMDGYKAIFEALHQLKYYCQLKNDIDLGERKMRKERAELLEQQWADGDMEVAKAIDIGSFVICKDAIACLRNFRKLPRMSLEYNSISDLASQEMEYLEDCIQNLIVIAHEDLKVAKKKKNK